MKAAAIAMAAMMGLFVVLTEPVQAGRYGSFTYCKSGARSQTKTFAKKTAASGDLLKAGNEPI